MISIAHNGQELGQFSADEVAAMVEGGQIDQTAHYWMEGMAEWRPITEIIQVDASPTQSASDGIAASTTSELSVEQLRDLWKRRSNAFVVDLLIGIGLLVFAFLIGGVVGFALALCGVIYLLIKDGLPNGQSAGKRIYRIKAISQKAHSACGFLGSVSRNGLLLLITLGPFFLTVVIATMLPLGWIFTGAACGLIVWIAISEREQILQPPYGQKRTDKWSQTRVVRSDLAS